MRAGSQPAASWASDQTGIVVSVEPSAALASRRDEPAVACIVDSIGLGLRRNPKRAHLLVSAVLGKHVPVRASVCLAAGEELGRAIARAAETASIEHPSFDVIGFAETATGLGHQVAHQLDAAMYVHTTRRPDPGQPRLTFFEEHSHAVDQALTPPRHGFDPGRVAVLVDDELSTGLTASNAIAALAPTTGHTTWIVASLLDTRSHEDQAWSQAQASSLGVRLLDAALLTGSVDLDVRSIQRAQALVASTPITALIDDATPTTARFFRLGTRGLATTGRRGFTPPDDVSLRRLARDAAYAFRRVAAIDASTTIVVGDEELMYFPQLLALELGDAHVCSTSRSPGLAFDDDSYPLRSAVAFDSVHEPGRTSYSYNTTRPGAATTLILVSEDPIDERCRRGVVAALATSGARLLVVSLSPDDPPGKLREIE
jgi:adenine/guanine phosphoribosyltransferase-like PRPP-binding protein